MKEIRSRCKILITVKLKLGKKLDDGLCFVCVFICCLHQLQRELTNFTHISVIYIKNAIFWHLVDHSLNWPFKSSIWPFEWYLRFLKYPSHQRGYLALGVVFSPRSGILLLIVVFDFWEWDLTWNLYMYEWNLTLGVV